MSLFLLSCEKKVNTKCKDCDVIRQFDVNIIEPSKAKPINTYIYDIVTINYCSSKTNHYVFESDIEYEKKINECLTIKCSIDAKGTQNCTIE
jgi:hypothetical protein